MNTAELGSGAMFDNIARRYDLLNRINSLGLDQRWRARAVRALEVLPGHRVLDLATGTADLAIAIAETQVEAHVTGVDPSRGMLEIGEQKVAARGLGERVQLAIGDATGLSFPEGSFDRVSIAFGMRNIADRLQALREIARVLRPGGRAVILELATPDKGVLAPFARFHVGQVVPRIGALLSGEREYRHLERSITAFPPAEEFAGLIAQAGLESVAIERMTFGACVLFVLRKSGGPS
jgi:demethylmenaquinone methyltransferase / 2-methoxy-6-polyprenyl-1,4-benzoquinol methylase